MTGSGVAFLDGVRVLDVTGALAGPYSTAILSDLGADVVKVERVDGDAMRRRRAVDGHALPFEMVQRNKRSIGLDFTRPEGRTVLRRLLVHADVLVENYRPGVMARHGLGYDDLKDDFPALVYASISGFGQTGPMREAKGVDLVAQGYAGLLSVTGLDEERIVKAGYPVSDLGAGMWACIGVLGALQRRVRTGEGAYVDVAMTDGVASWSVWEVSDYLMTGQVPRPLGTAHRLAAPYQAFRCQDGRALTMAAVERQWDAFCDLLGLDEVRSDDRFATEYSRWEHRDDLAAVLADRFLDRDRDDWIDLLREQGIPCGPVHDIPSMMEDEQLRQRGVFVAVDLDGSTETLVNTPVVSDGAPRIRRPAPRLGDATVALLTEAGYVADEIDVLVRSGVVSAAGARAADAPSAADD